MSKLWSGRRGDSEDSETEQVLQWMVDVPVPDYRA